MAGSFAVSIGVAALLMSATAVAKPRVAVVAFEGDDSGAVQEVVTDLLDGDYAVSGPKTVNRTLDKLGLDTDLSDKDLEKLANELEVDAILRGDLQQKGARKQLHVKLFVNGKKVRGFKVEFASVKSAKFKAALKDKIDEKLAGQEPKKRKGEETAEPAADAEDPIGRKKTKKTAKAEKPGRSDKSERAGRQDKGKGDDAAEQGEDEQSRRDPDEDKSAADDGEKRATKRTAAAEVDDEDVGGVEAGVTIEKSGSRHAANRVAIRVDVGPSASGRQLRFNSRSFEQAPKPYQNTPVGGMRVGGELYPLAFGDPTSILAGLGIAGHYDQTLKLNLRSTAQPGSEFPVTQKHWSVGARFRIAFGKGARAATVTLGGGYFHRMFRVDRTKLMMGNIIDLPDVFYRGFDPGLEFRIPIVEQVALLFGGQAVLVTSTGQIQKLDQYGRAKVTGGQGMAGIDIVVAGRVALRVSAEMAQFGFAFTGNGELTYNRDNDPTTPDVGGAADRYYGGSATLAVLY
jgi:hypothetical protein